MYCSNCGTEISRQLNYCNKCGLELQLTAAAPIEVQRSDSITYIATAIGFTTCGGLIALAVAAVKMAQLGVDGFGIGVFAVACASIIIGIASLLVNLMTKSNGVTTDNKSIGNAKRNRISTNPLTNQRVLDEHRDSVSPFSSITDRTTKIFEPAGKHESGNL